MEPMPSPARLISRRILAIRTKPGMPRPRLTGCPRQYITFRCGVWLSPCERALLDRSWRHNPGANTTPSTIPNPAAGSVVGNTTLVPGPFLSATPGFTCVAGTTGFCPDLRKDEPSMQDAQSWSSFSRRDAGDTRKHETAVGRLPVPKARLRKHNSPRQPTRCERHVGRRILLPN